MLNIKNADMTPFINEAEESWVKFDKIPSDTIDDINDFLSSYNKNF
jgi:hypothetical protein